MAPCWHAGLGPEGRAPGGSTSVSRRRDERACPEGSGCLTLAVMLGTESFEGVRTACCILHGRTPDAAEAAEIAAVVVADAARVVRHVIAVPRLQRAAIRPFDAERSRRLS